MSMDETAMSGGCGGGASGGGKDCDRGSPRTSLSAKGEQSDVLLFAVFAIRHERRVRDGRGQRRRRRRRQERRGGSRVETVLPAAVCAGVCGFGGSSGDSRLRSRLRNS